MQSAACILGTRKASPSYAISHDASDVPTVQMTDHMLCTRVGGVCRFSIEGKARGKLEHCSRAP